MKRKLSLLLAMVLAMTMVMGISVTAFAGYDGDGYYYPDQVEPCDHGDISRNLFYVSRITGGNASIFNYDRSGAPIIKEGDSTPERSAIGVILFPDGNAIEGRVYYRIDGSTFAICEEHNLPSTPGNDPEKTSAPAHTHVFQWQTITEPTKDADGLEGEVCSCGATRNTQKLSAYGYALNQYATSMVNAAKSGQTITIEFGEWNSFPKSFMAKLVDKSAQNVTFVFKYKWNHKAQTITIPAGTPIDLNFDWYGPAKMAELYGAN